MLLSFSFSNWMSFRDEVSLSFVAGREERFQSRLARVGEYKTKVLPIAAIYGGNASGKSALISALQFAQNFIIKGTNPDSEIMLLPFLLDNESENKPSSFSFVLLVEETLYEYSFTLSKRGVLSENLDILLKTTSKNVFERTDVDGKAQVKIGEVPKVEREILSLIGNKTTRSNQLFLTGTIYQNCNAFKSIYDWFKYKLVIINPGDDLVSTINFSDVSQVEAYSDLLNSLDTGVTSLDLNELPITENMKKSMIRAFENQLKDEDIILSSHPKERLVLRLEDGDLKANQLMFGHKKTNGNQMSFSSSLESDGTIRLLELIPAFMKLAVQSESVFVIDELDRSLHTQVSSALIHYFLSSCHPDKRSQLLFTTHDLMLMDQEVFRRDELWVTDRSADGISSLYSFSDFKNIRADRDIRKYYLQGNLKGIPNIMLKEACNEEES